MNGELCLYSLPLFLNYGQQLKKKKKKLLCFSSNKCFYYNTVILLTSDFLELKNLESAKVRATFKL